MTRTADVRSAILTERVVAIIRASDRSEAETTLGVLIAAGIRVLELSLTTPEAVSIIQATGPTLPEGVVLGAGTVRTAAEAQAAISAGASFLVAPTAAVAAFEVARASDVLFIPGALTPTEIDAARTRGASLIKLFPASLAGSGYVRDLLGPFPDLLLMPTGGVTIENAVDFLASGAVAVGIGGALTRGGANSIRAAATRLLANLGGAIVEGDPTRTETQGGTCQMHYYIEFVEPKPGISQQEFQQVVAASSDQWAREHPEDELVLNIGRTWRLGPRPGIYMTVWRVRDLAVLKRWNDEFRIPRIAEEHSEFARVATIVDAGLYADLGAEVW